MSDSRKIKRALISVYDKTGLPELAQGLHAAGVAIVSTGSTASQIAALGIPVTEVQEVTGFAECLDGRVKTLHPNIHAGLLADLRLSEHQQQLSELAIEPFELVVVNLYPFAQTVASGASFDDCIEKIDIGGPAMVRGSAKNHANVAVVVDPANYGAVIAAAQGTGFTADDRLKLAVAAFRHVATYDTAVATWLGATAYSEQQDFPAWVSADYERAAILRYGENPHQQAALYVEASGVKGIAGADQIHGKEMSYNNYVDADAARRAAYDFTEPAVAIIKHANPCGLAVGATIAQAYSKAHSTDPVSAFGGVIATNREVTKEMAEAVVGVFTEVISAPAFAADALEILQTKPNLRLLVTSDADLDPFEFRPISGGMLRQSRDVFQAAGDQSNNWQLVAGPVASAETLHDLEFAWRAVRCVKSNAILLAKNGGAVGIGMGQVNRVDSARLAVARAQARVVGSVAASDAFFPFADGLQVLLDAGVSAVVAPGGSVRDEEVIAAANAAGITMYFTGTRHFFH